MAIKLGRTRDLFKAEEVATDKHTFLEESCFPDQASSFDINL